MATIKLKCCGVLWMFFSWVLARFKLLISISLFYFPLKAPDTISVSQFSLEVYSNVIPFQLWGNLMSQECRLGQVGLWYPLLFLVPLRPYSVLVLPGLTLHSMPPTRTTPTCPPRKSPSLKLTLPHHTLSSSTCLLTHSTTNFYWMLTTCHELGEQKWQQYSLYTPVIHIPFKPWSNGAMISDAQLQN